MKILDVKKDVIYQLPCFLLSVGPVTVSLLTWLLWCKSCVLYLA